VDLQNAVNLQQNGHVDFQLNGYVNFGQWLGQVDPRRPAHPCLEIRGRKRHCMKKTISLLLCSWSYFRAAPQQTTTVQIFLSFPPYLLLLLLLLFVARCLEAAAAAA
jgi:hypothetical protein